MRISLENLSCPRLALDIVDASGSPRAIALDHLSQVSGTIEREGDRLRLMPLHVRELQVIGLEWLLPHGRIAIGTPATLAELAITADLVVTADGVPSMPTVAGTASLGLADAEDLTMVVAGQRISCDARLERLAMHLPAPGSAGTATIGALALRNLQTVLGKLFVRAGGIATDNAGISWRPAATTGSTIPFATGHIEAGADSLLIFDLTISGQGIELHTDRIEVSGGITRDRHDLHIGQVTISNVTIRVDDISSFLPAMSPAAPAASPAAPAASAPTGAAQRPLIDLSTLDRVSGTVAVDTTVIADIPVLGRRRAVHSFRVPVDSGAFSYRQLEAGLASLEDWVIKFRVRAGMLVVERDLVVSRRDLVRWRLDEEALALAQGKDKRVRLRTMLEYELAIELTSPSAIELRDIDANPIVITLSIAAGDTPAGQSPSAISDVSAERIELSGSLRYPHDSEQALELCAQGIAFSLSQLATSAVDIRSGQVSIERVAGLRLDFTGLTPRSLAATLTGIRLTNWHIGLRPD